MSPAILIANSPDLRNPVNFPSTGNGSSGKRSEPFENRTGAQGNPSPTKRLKVRQTHLFENFQKFIFDNFFESNTIEINKIYFEKVS